MRRLLPSPATFVDPLDACAVAAPPGRDRPWTVGLMASTADGAVTIGGVSGPIGGAGDAAVFSAVRGTADAIVVGAGTATTERYGPPRPAADVADLRTARGQAPRPTVFVVSGRLSVAPDLRLFTGRDPDDPRPVVIHGPDAPVTSRDRLSGPADVVEVPGTVANRIDPVAVVDEVRRRGHAVAVVEGGPRLLGTMVGADLLDELFLTIDPRVVGGDAPRVATGVGPGHDRPWKPVHLLEQDGTLFWRLRRDRD